MLNSTEKPSDLRSKLIRERYLRKGPTGRVAETARQMYARVARAIAACEADYGASEAEIHTVARRFYRMMRRGEFLPNSPTLMNAGRPDGLLSACFVLDIPDSIEGIFETVKRTALVQKAGGGTGFALDTLRPTGDLVASSGGQTSGPISFWRVIAEATNAIQQGANRRGANMGMMSVEHPDILKFITAKQAPGAFANFNISVKIPDAFMAKLESEPRASHVVTNPRTGRKYLLPRDLDIATCTLQDLLPASSAAENCWTIGDIWKLIVASAHATGEPGVCFIDRVNTDNTTPALGPIQATNPCGEQPLLANEACNLGSIDVAKLVRSDGVGLQWKRLAQIVRWAVRFLDDVVDANRYPVPEIRDISLANRKIGLGIMGFADALILMGMRYDSEEAIHFARNLAHFVRYIAHDASYRLARQRGAFPNWAGSIWDAERHCAVRNASCTTIAPTGSISIIAGCSSGIEPIYSLAYRRRALDGREFIHVHPLLERLGRKDSWMNASVRKALLEGVPPAQITAIPQSLAEVLVTAHKVLPEMHVRMQAAFQENVDNAVSKTVNLPASAGVNDVDKVFRLAARLGCKGITVYRDGARLGQVLSGAKADSTSTTPGRRPRARSRVTTGKTSKFRMGCGTLFVTVNKDENGLCEVFANLGKAGGCPSQSEATCRAVSAALRSGVDPEELIEQLRGIRCLAAARARDNGDGVNVLSCPDAIAKAIEETMGRAPNTGDVLARAACPNCGQALNKESGCLVCQACGYSKCG